MRAAIRVLAGVILLISCDACGPGGEERDAQMNEIAEHYVRLALALGRHDKDYVDAYYGPPEWSDEAERESKGLVEIGVLAQQWIERLEPLHGRDRDEMVALRRRYLTTQLGALRARVELLRGARMSFDEESRALYDAVAPVHDDEHYGAILDELAAALPGDAPLLERYEGFQARFVIPRDRLDAVFRAAIDACAERTRRHIELPEGESFELEFVRDKSWSAYNWYRGGFKSLIQLNTDLPIHIDRAIDLACHEGYPGHHTYNVLLERHLVRARGWVEFSIYPLFSPQSLIAEGTAEYGIRVAFPQDERVAFERQTLFPLAGLDPAEAERYYQVQSLVRKLESAANEAARRYLNGEVSSAAAVDWLSRFALMPRARAEQRVRFFDQYRSYVINYTLGRELVARHVESAAGGSLDTQRIWQEFTRLISSPRLPSDLVASGS